MSQPNFNDILQDEARSLALELDLPATALLKIFPVLSTAYFLGFEDGARQVLQSYDKHFGIRRHD